MTIKAIKNARIESVTLDNSKDKKSPIKSTMSVFASVAIDPTAGHGKGSDFSNIRLRAVVSYGKHSCQVMDYLSQRFDEYKNLGKDSSFNITVPSSQFVSFLKSDLMVKSFDDQCKDPYGYLEEQTPISPYSTKKEVVESVFKDRYVYDGDGKKLPSAMVMFDAPVVELVDSKIANALNSGEYFSLGDAPIMLDPLHFKFKDKSFEDNPQLSVYVYCYELPKKRENALQISLTTGMTPVSSYNLAGVKTNWPKITLSNPMIGIGYKNDGKFPETTTESAPDQGKLIVFDSLSNTMVFLDNLLELQRNLYDPDISSLLRKRKGVKKVIRKGNYFTDLWLTKDSDENKRFMFGFDLGSYLAEKSHFPYLYRHPKSAEQIINGRGLMNKQTPSYVMNMGVKRLYIDPPSMLPINNLGTSGYSTELGPSKSYPIKRILDIRKINNLVIPNLRDQTGDTGQRCFYEGKDVLDREVDPDSRNDGAFRYGVNFTVYDGSVIFVRQALKSLMFYRNILQDLHNKLITSPSDPFRERENNSDLVNVYNDSSGFLTVRSNNINIYSKFSEENISLIEHLSMVVQNYNEITSLFLRSANASMHQYFQERLLSNENYLEVAIMEEMIRYMNMFIHLLYRRLSEFFPTNPLGRDIPSLESSDFESRGILEIKAPFLRDEYYFDKKVTMGKDYGFGVDYIVDQEDNKNYKGITRVSTSYFRSRAGNELGKYFSSPQGQVLTAQGLYDGIGLNLGDSASRYFTPYVVRVPHREAILQPEELRQSVVYPLNKYAQLFADTFKHKSLIHPGGTHDPLVMDSNSKLDQNNRLYNSVINLLQEQHEVVIEEKTDFVYPSLDVLTGRQITTTAVDDLDRQNRQITAGPKAIPTIIGGNVDTNTTTQTYITTVDSSLTSQYFINKEGYTDSKQKQQEQKKRPIKLPFAIFGELSVDPQINFSIRYQEELFNSLKELSNQIGLNSNNISDFLSLPSSDPVPAQIKSMLVMAATKNVTNLFGLNIDASRPTLEDQDSDESSENVSVKIFGEEDNYQATGDPMKIYAKFMAFWMNYKQISVVEYLSGFDNLKQIIPQEVTSLDPSRSNKFKMPTWTPLTREIINQIEKELGSIFCRVRNYTLQEYVETLIPSALKTPQGYNDQVFDFPVYNQYFILGPPNPKETATEPIKKTSENECHEHTYYIDPKGNGWTSVAEHPESKDVKHRHQILNFVVQSAQSDCYPECEIKYGVKGAPPHIHELLGEETTTSQSSQSSTMDTSSGSSMASMTSMGMGTSSTSGGGSY